MQCPRCQHENRQERRFCAECGAPLDLACLACAFVNEPGERFCGGCGVALSGASSSRAPFGRHETEAELRFQAVLPAVLGLLHGQRRITYRTLKYILGLDDALLEEIREELTLRGVASDEAGKVLVWTGRDRPTAPAAPQQDTPETIETRSQVTPPLPALVTETRTSSHEPATPSETVPTKIPKDESAIAPEPTRIAPEAERRQLTVMFCDLADSTKLSQQLDPEDLREVVRAYQETAVAVIHPYEGHVAQYLGDGLLIYFGWPLAHEDDAQRSLHAGLEIVEAITTSLNPRLEQEKGVQLTVRLGVHTGAVVVGEMGSGGRHENLATGETVNIAARLEGLAAPNTVVLSQVTARLIRDTFALEDLGPHKLKGVAEPMQVFRVLGPMEINEDDTHVFAAAPFLVGRNEEVGLLLRRWGQSKEGLGQVVLISGEAGIGKSSLVATVRHHVVEAGYTRLTFRCSPYHTNSALYPVIEHVQRVLHFQPGDTPETKLDKLERVLKSYGRPLDEVVPLVADLLSVPVPEGRYAALNLSPQQQRRQTQDALVG
jgi:class 3 adenylate cyclase